jgi:aryl-phospho-beta-D-glucosidase BglC (GH1 family)
MNLSGMEFNPSSYATAQVDVNYTKHNNANYAYAASKGFNLIRLPVAWEHLQPTVGGALNATYKGYIDENIAWAEANGLKILLEIHNYGGRNIDGDNHKINDGTLTYAHFNNLWQRLSDAYKDNKTIWGYDLMNEPNGMPVATSSSNYNTTATWTIAAQGAIDTIRDNGDTHPIVVETDNWSGVQAFFSTHGASPTPWYTDPLNKLYYSCHYYFDSDHSGTYDNADTNHEGTGLTITSHGDALEDLAQWAEEHDVNLFIGEYGVPNTGSEQWNTALHDFMTVMDQYNIAGTHWAFGDWYTSSTTVQPANGVDKRQMEIIGAHLGTI